MKLAGDCDQSCLKIVIHSSVTAPGALKAGLFSASNSSFSQRVPTPKVSRAPAVGQHQRGGDEPQPFRRADDHPEDRESPQRIADARVLAIQ